MQWNPAPGIWAVWGGEQGGVELPPGAGGGGGEDSEEGGHRGRHSEVPPGGSHHGSVPSPQHRGADGRGHSGRACEHDS